MSSEHTDIYLTYRICRLFCPFVYLPVSRAEPPARLRLEAYRDGTALVGPDGDPDGWQVCPPTHLHGTLFDNRQVDVEYTVSSSALPLNFAIDIHHDS